MGGRGFGFISYRGDVQTCGFLDISAGNLIEDGYDFGGIWEGSEFLNEIRNLPGCKGNCGVCEYVSICGGDDYAPVQNLFAPLVREKAIILTGAGCRECG